MKWIEKIWDGLDAEGQVIIVVMGLLTLVYFVMGMVMAVLITFK